MTVARSTPTDIGPRVDERWLHLLPDRLQALVASARKATLQPSPRAGAAFGLIGRQIGQANHSRVSELREQAHAALASHAESLAQSLDDLLSQLAPPTAVDLAARRDDLDPVLESIGVNRFQWALAVGAGGSSSDPRLVHRYYSTCSQWFVAASLAEQFRDVDAPLGIGAVGRIEQLRRLTPTVTGVRWLARLISRETAEAATRFPQLDLLSPAAITGLADYVDSCLSSWQAWDLTAPAPLLAPEVERLLGTIAVDPGCRAGQPFTTLATAREAEIQPFVRFADRVLPVALREAALAPEVSLVELVQQRAGSKVKGQLFEDLVRRVVTSLLPSGVDDLRPPLEIRTSGKRLEVDAAFLLDSRTLLLIECKGRIPPRQPYSTQAALGDELADAVDQVTLRVRALEDGCALRHADGAIGMTELRECRPAVVSLYPYGWAAWSPTTIDELRSGAQVDVIPLASLALVLSVVRDGAELARYLRLRAVLRSRNINASDELEYLLYHLNPRRDRAIPDVQLERGLFFTRSYALPWRVASLTDPPSDIDAWRKIVYDLAEPVW